MARAFPWEKTPERFGQIPKSRGIVFVCKACGYAYASTRDGVLKAWGERGVIREAAQKLRCRRCRKLGMYTSISPRGSGLGSLEPLDALVSTIKNLKPKRTVS
jgi:hypothetical protein